MATCPDGSTPLIIENDGVFYPACSSTGIFYVPQLLPAVLGELLFPSEWSIIPPG